MQYFSFSITNCVFISVLPFWFSSSGRCLFLAQRSTQPPLILPLNNQSNSSFTIWWNCSGKPIETISHSFWNPRRFKENIQTREMPNIRTLVLPVKSDHISLNFHSTNDVEIDTKRMRKLHLLSFLLGSSRPLVAVVLLWLAPRLFQVQHWT